MWQGLAMKNSILCGGLRRFARHESGNFAIIFSLAALPLAGLAGLALDYSRISSTKDKLQASVDAAIIAAAANGNKTGGDKVSVMQNLVADFVEANFDEPGVKVNTVVDTYVMRVEARYTLDLPVMAAVGKPQTEIIVTAEVTSRVPLRGGAVAAPGQAHEFERQVRQARQKLMEATRTLPREMRESLEAQFNAHVRQARESGGSPSSFHLSQ